MKQIKFRVRTKLKLNRVCNPSGYTLDVLSKCTAVTTYTDYVRMHTEEIVQKTMHMIGRRTPSEGALTIEPALELK